MACNTLQRHSVRLQDDEGGRDHGPSLIYSLYDEYVANLSEPKFGALYPAALDSAPRVSTSGLVSGEDPKFNS